MWKPDVTSIPSPSNRVSSLWISRLNPGLVATSACMTVIGQQVFIAAQRAGNAVRKRPVLGFVAAVVAGFLLGRYLSAP